MDWNLDKQLLVIDYAMDIMEVEGKPLAKGESGLDPKVSSGAVPVAVKNCTLYNRTGTLRLGGEFTKICLNHL